MAVIVVRENGSGDYTTLAAAVSAAIADDEIEIQGAWTVDDTASFSVSKNLTIRAVGEAKHPGRPFKTGDTHYRFRPSINYAITISSAVTLDLDDVDLQNASTGTSHELIRCTTPGVVINVNRSLCGMASRVDQQDIIYSERGLTVNANNSHFYNAYRAVIDFYGPNSGSDGTFNFNSCTFSRCGNTGGNGSRSGVVGYHANSASGTSTVVINMLNCLIDVVAGGVTNIQRATNLNDSVTVNIDNCVTNANTWMQSGNVGVGINTTNDTLSATVTDSTAASAYIVNDLSEATPDLRLTDHSNNLAIENHSVASASNSALTMPTDELLKGERVAPYDLGAYAIKCATPRVIGVRSTLQQPDSANHDFAIPSDVVAGNLLMLVSAYNDSNTQTLTDWTTLDSGARAGVFVKSSDGTETVANLTTSPNTQSAGYVLVIDNWSGDINDVEYASIETTTDTPDPPAITAPWGADNNLFGSVIMARRGDNEITAFPTNYDDNQNAADTTSGSGGASIGLATRNLNAASDDPSTFTKANTHVCHAASFVIKPFAAGGGGSTKLDLNVGSAITIPVDMPDPQLVLDSTLALNASRIDIPVDTPDANLVLGRTLALNASSIAIPVSMPDATLVLDKTLALEASRIDIPVEMPNPTWMVSKTINLLPTRIDIPVSMPDPQLLLSKTLNLNATDISIPVDMPDPTLILGRTLALNSSSIAIPVDMPDATLELTPSFTTDGITGGLIRVGNPVTIDLIGKTEDVTLSCHAGSIVEDSQDADSVTFTCMEPPLFGDLSLNYQESITITVHHGAETSTETLIINPRANEAFGQITSVTGFYLDDVGVEVGMYAHYKNFTGDLLVDPADGTYNNSVESSVDYAIYDGGVWSGYVTEPVAAPSVILDLQPSSAMTIPVDMPNATLVLGRTQALEPNVISIPVDMPDATLVLDSTLALEASVISIPVDEPDPIVAFGRTQVLEASSITIPVDMPDATLVIGSQIPKITLVGGDVIVYKDTPFTEPGYSAYDEQDGVITGDVVITGSVNTAITGTYTLFYDVTDSNLNDAPQVSRNVMVIEEATGDDPKALKRGLRRSLRSPLKQSI